MSGAEPEASANTDLKWAGAELRMLLSGRVAVRLALRGSEPGWRRFRSAQELRAYHEVGHCVSALCSGRHVYELTITPNPIFK